jgi:hypothetical protein
LNPEDAVKEALALWEERERARAEFRETLDDAEASLARSEGTEITRESMRELTDGIMERTGARIAAEQKRPAKWHTASPNAPRRTWKTSPITSPRKAAASKPPSMSSSPSRTDFTCLGPIPTPAELETTIWAQAAEASGRPIYHRLPRLQARRAYPARGTQQPGHRGAIRPLSEASEGPQGPPHSRSALTAIIFGLLKVIMS